MQTDSRKRYLSVSEWRGEEINIYRESKDAWPETISNEIHRNREDGDFEV